MVPVNQASIRNRFHPALFTHDPVKKGTGTFKTLSGKDSAMPSDPLSHLRALIEKYTVVSTIPDIRGYRNIKGPRAGVCIFKGCTEPIAWEDARGGNFLCEGHYLLMTQWIDEARKGLISGDLSALFDRAAPQD
jgi:hypothetical protein